MISKDIPESSGHPGPGEIIIAVGFNLLFQSVSKEQFFKLILFKSKKLSFFSLTVTVSE